MLAVVGILATNRHKNDPTPAATAATPPTTIVKTVEEPAAKMVQVKVTTTPPNASVYLDGARLDGSPATARMRADGADHPLRIVAPGFQTDSRMVKFDNDIDLNLTLTPEADKKPPAVTGRPVGGPAPTPTSKAKGPNNGVGIDKTNPFGQP